MTLFHPPPRIVPRVDSRGARTLYLHELIAAAGARCKATGSATERLVHVATGEDGVEREPGDWGAVRIGVPTGLSSRDAARHALATMAYGLHDLVARESIRGQPWARPRPPRGRPKTGAAMSNRERQRAHRARRRRAEMKRKRARARGAASPISSARRR